MSELELRVGGRRYAGWTRVRVSRGMETMAGSFEVQASDRWDGQADPWPIVEESECSVLVDGETVIRGYVDRRRLSLGRSERRIEVMGRDTAAALVDCSVPPDRLQYRNAAPLTIARNIASPFGVAVSVAPGVTLPPRQKRFAVGPGESAFTAIERLARSAGVLAVSDASGGIVLTGAGTVRADALIEGQNLFAVTADFDATERYRSYVVLTQAAGTDNAFGGATRVRAEATDEGVARADRVLVLRPQSGVSGDYARRLADWEARVRAARADRVSAVVVGWRQLKSGAIWAPNARCFVSAPSVGVSGEMLISSVELALDDGGEVANLTLVRPDAYTPEPEAVVGEGGTRWKELAGGV